MTRETDISFRWFSRMDASTQQNHEPTNQQLAPKVHPHYKQTKRVFGLGSDGAGVSDS